MATEEMTDTGFSPDDFELAFAAASTDAPIDETPPDEVAPDTATDGEATPPEGANTDGEGAEGEAPPPEEPPKSEPKPEPPAPKPEPKPEPPAPSAEEQAAAQAAVDAAKAKEVPTTEEQALLDQVTADFPEVAQAMAVHERTLLAKIENLFSSKLTALTEQFNQRIAPTESVAQTIARDQHTSAILSAHADAFDVLPKVDEWVATKPSFLQASYNAVLDQGSAAEVVELLNIFKKETGSVHVPPAPQEDAAKQAAKEKKLQSQEGVRSRQAAQKGGIDENDFDSAFNAAASM